MKAPFHSRDARLADPNLAGRYYWVNEVDAQIEADLRDVHRVWLAGATVGLIVSGLIWWLS